MPSAKTPKFSAAVVRWQKQHGRHSLPWNAERDPYKIWVSETMLQQTQAAAVIPYYQKFIRRFPTAAKLARARPRQRNGQCGAESAITPRARRLHSAAKIIAKNGIPHSARRMAKTPPGIGKSTAAAIAVFSRGERAAILDGNVKRVLARFFAMELPMDSAAGRKRIVAAGRIVAARKKTHPRLHAGNDGFGRARLHSRPPAMRRLPAGRTMRGTAKGNRRIASQTAGEKGQAAKNGVDGNGGLRRPRFFAKASGGGHLGRLAFFPRSGSPPPNCKNNGNQPHNDAMNSCMNSPTTAFAPKCCCFARRRRSRIRPYPAAIGFLFAACRPFLSRPR